VSATGSAAAGASASGGAKGAAVALTLTKVKLLVAGSLIVTAASASVFAIGQDRPVAAVMSVATAAAPAPSENGESLVGVPAATAEAKAGDLEVKGEAEPPTSTRANTAVRGRENLGAPSLAKQVTVVDDEAAPAAISQLRQEAALLQEMRAALGRHDTAGARAMLNDARRRFPNSQLVQERDALEVRLTNESGDRTGAASLARTFAERYPDSPLRAGVESIARGAEKK
jgi:hypothetical protein